MDDRQILQLLGRDHAGHGVIETRAASDGRAGCALSVGSGAGGASGKHDPNEDAVLVVDTGDACLLAVADAHYGASASHRLLERIAAEVPPTVRNLFALGEAVAALRDDAADPDDPSETTLVLAVLQRHSRRGFGLSFGDSSCLLLSPGGKPRSLAPKQGAYVTLARPMCLGRDLATTFRFVMGPEDLLVVHTDGVDECHYGQPRTSVRPRHMTEVFTESAGDPLRFVERLAATALAGVDGNPGGEDNLAIAAAVL